MKKQNSIELSHYPNRLFYPYCAYPNIFDDYKSDPSVFYKKPTPPIEPKKPRVVEFSYGVFIYLIISIILGILHLDILSLIALALFIITIVAYFIGKEKANNEKMMYPHLMKKYEKEMLEYQSTIKEFELNVSKSWPDLYYKKVKSYYDNSTKPNYSASARKGKSELLFYKILCDYFEDVLLDKAIKLERNMVYDEYYGSSNVYVPDIIIKFKGILIDIEIDEPYCIIKKDKIFHPLDSPNDALRDAFFVNHGWLVIRFAEEQVIKYPLDCILFIHEAIEEIIELNGLRFSSEEWKSEYSDIQPMQRWRSIDRDLIKKKYRENYLSDAKL